MPRQRARGKWNLRVSPNKFYEKPDPFNIFFSDEEENKSSIICSLINYDGFGIDIGCGEGRFTECYACIKPFIGLDISRTAIGRAKGRMHKARYVFGDITSPLPKSEASTIILSEVLYYIKPKLWDNVSKNIKRMLSKDGQFIVSVGQYFTEEDIRNIFHWCKFDKVFKLPSEKYEYNLIMSGRKR